MIKFLETKRKQNQRQKLLSAMGLGDGNDVLWRCTSNNGGRAFNSGSSDKDEDGHWSPVTVTQTASSPSSVHDSNGGDVRQRRRWLNYRWWVEVVRWRQWQSSMDGGDKHDRRGTDDVQGRTAMKVHRLLSHYQALTPRTFAPRRRCGVVATWRTVATT